MIPRISARFPSLVLRLVLGVTAVLGLQAIAWQWHPAHRADEATLAPAVSTTVEQPSRYVLPSVADPVSYLEMPERPDLPGELAPPEAQPPNLRQTPPPTRVGASPPPAVSAPAYLVLDEGSGQVLFAQNGHRRRAPASTTKIMTALLAVQLGKLDQEVVVDVLGESIPDSTLVYIAPGDRLTLRDLVYGLMLHSGNDCAVQIAHTIAGSEAEFVELMNRRAQELGLRDTHFANPHGLDEGGLFSSAYDLAVLSRHAMGYPDFAAIVGAKHWRVQGPPSYGMLNGNRLLSEYEGADGVKIGFTDFGGQTIVASVKRGGHRVYVAVLGSKDRIADTKGLLDYTFANFRWQDGASIPPPSVH